MVRKGDPSRDEIVGAAVAKGIFDHVLRSQESYGVKQQYVMENPVRAGLVQRPEDWNYRGEIAQLLR
jgi:hypothetical protein